MEKSKLTVFRWHRLIKVLFAILTIIGIVIWIILADWYFFMQTLSYTVLSLVIWVVVTNLMYYEWLIYI